MISKLIEGLLSGLSGPQVLASKLIGSTVALIAVYFAYTSWSHARFQAGFDSRNKYVAEIEGKFAAAESERLRLDALLTECNRLKDIAVSKSEALTTQLSDLSEKSTNMLLETQKINAQALAAASRKSTQDAGFYDALTAKLEGLKNECDANGNATVPGGADILRAIQQKE